ncbi:alpha/beta fold hydrolase [Streptomyces sp. NPDC017529]|uniref:alpha/beta fold hydrolase n=1 Tax=Streptomyces sp. NPDC017529 TaxID=3365000 RepID=UPI0037A75103
MTGAKRHELAARVQRDRNMLEGETRSIRLNDGTSVRLARFGHGPLVICVGTVPELGFVYAPHIRALESRYQIVVYEPRMSRSERVSVEDRAEELTAVAESLDEGPAHVLSWSDAGAAAYSACIRRPELFRSAAFLGLADAYFFPGPLNLLAKQLYHRPIERLFPAIVLRLLLSHYLSGRCISPLWVYSETRRIGKLPLYFKHSILPLMLEHDSSQGEVPFPTLMVAGGQDTLVQVRQARAMAHILGPRCEFVLLPEGEHFLGYAAPETVGEALIQFYTSADKTAENTE